MKHTKEEIVAALRVIKDECAHYGHVCEPCPFYQLGGHCIIQESAPMHWNIVDIEPEKTWRAFK